MSFVYTPGFFSLATVFDGLKAAIEDIDSPGFTLVKDGTGDSFTTTTGSETAAGRYAVYKTKLVNNTGGSGVGEYSYVILEEDTTNSRIIVRTCVSFTTGGVSVDVTPLADVEALNLFITDLTSQNAVAVSGGDKAVSLTVETTSAIHTIALFSIRSPLGSTQQNKHVGLFKAGESSVWVLPTTLYATTTYSIQRLGAAVENPQAQDHIHAGPFNTLATFYIGDTSVFIGLTRGLVYSDGTTPGDFDIIDLFESADNYRVFTVSGGGFIGVQT